MSPSSVVLIAALGTVGQSSIPEYKGNRVVVAGVRDDFAPVRSEIERLEKSSRQRYFVAVVRSIDKGDYVDRVYREWAAQARNARKPIDPARFVLVVVAVDDQKIQVLAGSELQERYGLRGATITKELIQPKFVPQAKAHDYAKGLTALIGGIEEWVDARDRETARRQEQVAKDAAAVLAVSGRLLDELRDELKARAQSGLDLSAFEKQRDDGIARRARLEGQQGTDPQAALTGAQELQKSLQQALADLRGLSALQAQAEEKRQKALDLLSRFEQALEKPAEAGLAVKPYRAIAEEETKRLADLAEVARRDPARAMGQLIEIDQRLSTSLARVERLPALKKQLDERLPRIREEVAALTAEVEDARRAGVGVEAAQQQLQEAETRLARAEQLAKTDYSAALEALDATEATVPTARGTAVAARSSHTFWRRYVPIMVFGSLTAIGAILLLLRWWSNARFRRQVAGQLKAARSEGLKWMDRLDALKDRHKNLPQTDKDYTEPMQGQTLAFYQQTEKELAALWDDWLKHMESLEQAQSHYAKGRGGQAQDALKAAPPPAAFDERCKKAETDLDRLNNAHELAEELTKQSDEAGMTARRNLEALAKHGLATAPHEAQLQECRAVADEARILLRADPLSAQDLLRTLNQRLKDQTGLIDRLLKLHDGYRKSQAELEEVTALARQKRSEGLRLAEEGGNPDTYSTATVGYLRATDSALNGGDADAAETSLKQAGDAVRSARAGIERHVKARADWGTRSAGARQELNRLGERLKQAVGTEARLERDHARTAWTAVAGNRTRAAEQTTALATLLRQAEAEAAEDRQHYLNALRLLDQFQAQAANTNGLLSGLDARLKELEQLREQCQARRQFWREEREVESVLAANAEAIRSATRERLRSAKEAARRATLAGDGSRPDWAAIDRALSMAEAEFAAARQQVEAEVQGYRDFRDLLGRVMRRADEVGTLLGRHTADRPPANQTYKAARYAFDQLRATTRDADWHELSRQLQQVGDDLDRAESLAAADIDLARQAVAELGRAEQEIWKAHGFSSMGVTTETGPAQNLLQQGRGLLEQRDYERAIAKAGEATQSARLALTAATALADQRRQQSLAAPVAQSGPPPPPEARSSGAATASWESGSSEGRW